MPEERTIRVSHLLFQFLGWVDYDQNQNWPENEVKGLRSDFIDAIWCSEDKELKAFCENVIRLQQYRYQLNGTAGVETKLWVPKGMERQFQNIPFDAESRIERLKETFLNQMDPGIIVQQCLHSSDLQKSISQKISQWTDAHLIYFSRMIDALGWFLDSQSSFWFTYHPELIPTELRSRFWFVDENYLGEKDFARHES